MYRSSVHSANHAAKNIASSGRKYVSKCGVEDCVVVWNA